MAGVFDSLLIIHWKHFDLVGHLLYYFLLEITKCLMLTEITEKVSLILKWKFFFNFKINLFLILGEEITEEKYNNFATDDEINPYSPEHQFKLTKALNVLHIKPSTFHSYYTSGKYHKVHIWNFYMSIIYL